MARVAVACFERFQRARVEFVTEVAELATKPDAVETLHDEGVLSLLRPMLSDAVRNERERDGGMRNDNSVNQTDHWLLWCMYCTVLVLLRRCRQCSRQQLWR